MDAKAHNIPKRRGRSLQEPRSGGGRSLWEEEGDTGSRRRADNGGSRCLCKEVVLWWREKGDSGLGEEGERLAAP
jgi:hypothetical protein